MISILEDSPNQRKERRLPSPEKFASCPYEGRILDFYQGQFDSVFVLLHPFIRCESLDPQLFYPETYPNKTEILANCASLNWKEVMDRTGLQDINAVDIGLRTGIAGLKEEFGNEEFAAAIESFEASYPVVRPSEGKIPELLQNTFYEALQCTGEEWLWIADEFDTERKLRWIDDLESEELPWHCQLFTPDKSVQITTHWDSHFSFLCSSRERIEEILRIHRFEGFFCDESTEVYWSLRSPVSITRVI